MKSVSITDFSGGIQESTSPDDFTNRQWAKLRGIMPKDNTTFESQWAAQSLSRPVYEDLSGPVKLELLQPLETDQGTFLIGIGINGGIYWAKMPPTTVTINETADIVWREVFAAENMGFKNIGWETPALPNGAIQQPKIEKYGNVNAELEPNGFTRLPGAKFVATFPLEAYKYDKTVFAGRAWDSTQDLSENRGLCPAVLITGTNIDYYVSPDSVYAGSPPHIWTENKRVLVAYVDSGSSADCWTGSSWTFDDETMTSGVSNTNWTGYYRDWLDTKIGTVKLISFPNFRRWPTWKDDSFPSWSISGSYAAEKIYKPIQIIRSTTAVPAGTTTNLVGQYPYFGDNSGVGVVANTDTFLRPSEYFHPYTYLDEASVPTLLPGRGIIPEANVGTFWGGQLIIGDILWRSDKATSADKAGKATPGRATALVGALNDDTTVPHRGSFYYGEDDIDIFDPRSVIRATSSDARLAGMHVLDNRLICITTAGTENDGVVSFTGNLGQLHPYGAAATPNPYAIRKQLVRGGVGVADYKQTDGISFGRQTCLWSEVGIVVFIDRLGGVFYTDGQSCDRLDRVGPKSPAISTHYDHVAAAGKHLFVWRDSRLLAFSIVDSSGSMAQGCWTEVIAPAVAYTGADKLKSMIGSGSQLFMLVDGVPYRYAPASPHKGTIDEVPVEIEIATQTVGDLASHKKTAWQRIGLSFYTPEECTLTSATVKAEAYFQQNAVGETTLVPSYTIAANNTYQTGHFDFVAPAGVGPQYVMSASFKFLNHVVLKGFTAWAHGEIPSRIEP